MIFIHLIYYKHIRIRIEIFFFNFNYYILLKFNFLFFNIKNHYFYNKKK